MNSPLWFSDLASWSAQVALVVLAAGILPRVFQIRQPRVLLVYWRALIATSLLLPLLQPWSHAQNSARITFSRVAAVENANILTTTSHRAASWHVPSIQMIAQVIALIILAGIAARFIILVAGLIKLRQFRRASTPLSTQSGSMALLDEMRVRVNTGGEFRLSMDVDSPVTFGFSDPVILLPERFPSLGPQSQAAIVCHELLHVRRSDWAHHLAEEFFRATLWFHPAIAWLVARIRLAREQVVDQEVIRLTAARKPYLEALLEFTASRKLPTAIPAPPFLAERQLAERIALMLKEVRMSRTRLIASLTAMFTVVFLAAMMGAWTFPLKGAVSLFHSHSATLTPEELTIRPATAWEVKSSATSNAKLAPGHQDQPPSVTVTIKGSSTLVSTDSNGKTTVKPLPEELNRQLAELAKQLSIISKTQSPAQQAKQDKDKPAGKVYQAGKDGVSMPSCVYCPRPDFVPEAKKTHTTGTVYLEVTVLENGHVGEIKLVRGIGHGLDEKAIETVRNTWTFKPAFGPDSKPVAATVPVEISFQLWGQEPETPMPGDEQDFKIFTAPVSGGGETTPFYMGKVKTEVIFAPHPIFPQLAKQMGIKEGEVDIDTILDTEGNVIAASLVKASHGILIQPAMDMVRTWKIKGTHDGEPVSFQTRVHMKFEQY